jgi:hypothetical protein
MIMVKKHNLLWPLALSIALGAGTGIYLMDRNHRIKQKAYRELVQREAARFKGCPDRLKAGWGSCAAHDQRVKMREKAKGYAEKGEYLKACQQYIELGDWVNARAMAGKTSGKKRATLKREIKIRRDAIKEACPDCKLDR